MDFISPEDLRARAGILGRGPVLMILCEDDTEIEGTIRHHIDAGFRQIVLAVPPAVRLPDVLPEGVHRLTLDQRPDNFAATCVNALIDGLPEGAWMAYVYNAEYLFHPFAETRRIGEALTFCTEERRDAVLTFIVDLYAGDLTKGSNAVDTQNAWIDEAGYFALARTGEDGPLDRQLDFFGGLRWRFEEHIPWERRRIDRVSLFRVRKSLRLLPDHRLSDEEMNTFSCPWHHSMTASLASFRAAKALATNPGSRAAIRGFKWDGSTRFEWRAQQLMDLGLMEPGQWF
ncbi:hypothetical protein SAMN05444004_10254 [Jannaschia faecimaris]|uniref:Glycosyl transferase family 2 n=1 Tax=Jannaschia faecimaris TaxID=1244108 RepID=A0A1H3L2P2_9RHOB|nr:hypothetical protein [Jannaschia faecimaris]SDY58218.1 hypothetical protein SAMN05444004_10254 [Jannaschia faecimaris]